MTFHWAKTFLLLLFAAIMIYAGYSHFANPAPFVSIVPAILPFPRLIVSVSGFFEIAGGIGLIYLPTRKAASIGLIALLIAVFPANVNMAVYNLPLGATHVASWILWLRLPLQGILIWWSWWCGELKATGANRSEGIHAKTNE